MRPGEVLQTKRLLLRPFEKDDAPPLYRLSREETLRARMPDQVYATLEEAVQAAVFLRERALTGAWPYVLGIALLDTGELIGHVGMNPIPEGMEIGYAMAMAHQGKGYATEAVAAFSKWAPARFSLPGLWGILMADNGPSRRVLEKAGYALLWRREREAFGGRHLCLGYFLAGEDGP